MGPKAAFQAWSVPDHGDRPVVVRDVQLRQQRDLVAVEVAVAAVEADPAAVPAVGQPRADGVVAVGARAR